jgi:hypothetical protein
LAKLTELESRVAQIKDWKQKYEEDKRQWDEEKQELQKRADGVLKLREVLIQLMGLDTVPAPAQSTKETLNLKHKELVVNLAHEEKELNMTTRTVMGKVLFCALTELSKEGFSEAELSEILKEHGWNVLHNTLAPTLGGLVRDGYLVKLEGIKPAKYRLPEKVKLNVSREGG